MLPQNFAFFVDKITRFGGFLQNVVDIAGIKVLTVGLVAYFQPSQTGKLANFGFLVTAQRQQNAAQFVPDGGGTENRTDLLGSMPRLI